MWFWSSRVTWSAVTLGRPSATSFPFILTAFPHCSGGKHGEHREVRGEMKGQAPLLGKHLYVQLWGSFCLPGVGYLVDKKQELYACMPSFSSSSLLLPREHLEQRAAQ